MRHDNPNLDAKVSDPEFTSAHTHAMSYKDIQDYLDLFKVTVDYEAMEQPDLELNLLLTGYLYDLMQCYVNDNTNQNSINNQIVIIGTDDLKKVFFKYLPPLDEADEDVSMHYQTNLALYFSVLMRFFGAKNEIAKDANSKTAISTPAPNRRDGKPPKQMVKIDTRIITRSP